MLAATSLNQEDSFGYSVMAFLRLQIAWRWKLLLLEFFFKVEQKKNIQARRRAHMYTYTPPPTLPLPPKCNGAEVKLEARIAPLASFLSGLCVSSRLLKLKLWDSSSSFHTDGQFTKDSLGFRGLPLLSLWVSPWAKLCQITEGISASHNPGNSTSPKLCSKVNVH